MFFDDKKAVTITAKAKEVVKDLDLMKSITAISFDTTATNTDRKGGICVRLSGKEGLNLKLIWLPCSHHVAELVLASVISVWE